MQPSPGPSDLTLLRGEVNITPSRDRRRAQLGPAALGTCIVLSLAALQETSPCEESGGRSLPCVWTRSVGARLGKG